MEASTLDRFDIVRIRRWKLVALSGGLVLVVASGSRSLLDPDWRVLAALPRPVRLALVGSGVVFCLFVIATTLVVVARRGAALSVHRDGRVSSQSHILHLAVPALRARTEVLMDLSLLQLRVRSPEPDPDDPDAKVTFEISDGQRHITRQLRSGDVVPGTEERWAAMLRELGR